MIDLTPNVELLNEMMIYGDLLCLFQDYDEYHVPENCITCKSYFNRGWIF